MNDSKNFDDVYSLLVCGKFSVLRAVGTITILTTNISEVEYAFSTFDRIIQCEYVFCVSFSNRKIAGIIRSLHVHVRCALSANLPI